MLIDNTSLEHFTTCARNAEYYLLRNRELNVGRSALVFGGTLHECLEMYYRNPGKELEFYLKNAEPIIQEMPEPEDPKDFRTRARAFDAFLSYCTSAIGDDFVVLNDEASEPYIERYFELPLGDVEFNSTFNGKFFEKISVRWTGRIDLIIQEGDTPWVLDHKTTRIVGDSFFGNFYNSQQTIGYTWAASQLLKTQVAGLFLNALAIRPVTKTGVPFELCRQKFPYQPSRVEEWVFNTLTLVSDFLSHLDRGFFPMETQWCVGKYGKCQFFDVCTLPAEQRETMLTSNFYKDVTWTPKHR